jgi:2-oxoglutarate ferredoxin oxidoreductase subunit alpha
MNEKRIHKLDPLKRRRDLFLVEGDAKASVALVAWGSVAGVVREAFHTALEEGIQAKLLVPKLLYPVAEEVYREFFLGVQAGLVVEQSHQGQLFHLIRMFVDLPANVWSFKRSGSNPILPAAVLGRLERLTLELQQRQAPEAQQGTY